MCFTSVSLFFFFIYDVCVLCAACGTCVIYVVYLCAYNYWLTCLWICLAVDLCVCVSELFYVDRALVRVFVGSFVVCFFVKCWLACLVV